MMHMNIVYFIQSFLELICHIVSRFFFGFVFLNIFQKKPDSFSGWLLRKRQKITKVIFLPMIHTITQTVGTVFSFKNLFKKVINKENSEDMKYG